MRAIQIPNPAAMNRQAISTKHLLEDWVARLAADRQLEFERRVRRGEDPADAHRSVMRDFQLAFDHAIKARVAWDTCYGPIPGLLMDASSEA